MLHGFIEIEHVFMFFVKELYYGMKIFSVFLQHQKMRTPYFLHLNSLRIYRLHTFYTIYYLKYSFFLSIIYIFPTNGYYI